MIELLYLSPCEIKAEKIFQLFSGFLVLALLLPSPLAKAAQDFIFLPRVKTGIMHYEYEVGTEGSTSAIKDGIKLKEILPFLGVGLTLAIPERFFLSTYFQTTTTEDSDDKGILARNRNTELERQDYSVSFGSQFPVSIGSHVANLSIFLGYKSGQTNYDWIEENENIESVKKENDFVANGPFIGAAYNWQIGPGKVGLRLALAKLDGEITTRRVHTGGTLVGQERKEQVFSETTGFKVGVNWNAKITDRWSYGFSLDGFKYNFKPKKGTFSNNLFSDNRGHEILDLAPYEVEETVYSLSLLVRYRF
jgi:hypothetical protein